jgi:hypothetical protein
MPTCSDQPRDELKPLPTASIAMATEAEAPSGLYERLLGRSWLQLAEPVRFAHRTESMVCARGRLRIARGRGYVARVLAALLRLPRANGAAETRLVVTSRGDVEHWRRTFDDRCLATRQYATGDRELGERIGVLEFRFRLEASEGSLVFRQVEAAVVCGSVRVRIPAAWAPRVEAREDPAGAHRIGIHVRLVLPALGPVLIYDGIIDLEEQRA